MKALVLCALISSSLIVCTAPKKTYETTNTITVSRGQRFSIVLPSNPTTGYDWHWIKPEEGKELETLQKHIKLVKESYMPSNKTIKGKALMGAGGKKKFTFKATGKGSTPLTFEYKRIWERQPADQVKKYTIDIR